MKSVHFVSMFVLASTMVLAQANPVPLINQPLVPASVAPGGAGFTLTVTGTGFVSSSVIEWNGVPLVTSVVSSQKLTAKVSSARVAVPGTASVTVVNPGAVGSNTVYFPIVASESVVKFNLTPLAGSSSGTNLITGDFNNDGIPDLAANYSASGGVSVFLGNGRGRFRAGIYSGCGAYYQVPVVAGDFNGDGKLDLMVGYSPYNYYSYGQVCLGHGDGTFTALPAFSVSAYPESFFAADFNRDGKLDIAMVAIYADGYSEFGYVQILLGNGDGTFQAGQSYSISSGYGYSVAAAVGDFNGDGTSDLAVTTIATDQVGILLSNGDGTFHEAVYYNTGTDPQWVAAADFNADGKLDLAIPNLSSNTVSILMGNGDGTFQSKTDYATGTQPEQVVVGDFNGDGKLDLAVTDYYCASNCATGSFSLLIGNEDGTFQSHLDFVTGIRPYGLAMGDFNNDGRLDLATADGTISVILQGEPRPNPVLSPTSMGFDSQNVGTSSYPQTVTLTNAGSGRLTINSIDFTGANPGDFTETNTCKNNNVPPGGSCTLSITFSPTATGARAATLEVNDNAPGSPQTVNLTGTGVAPAVNLSPTDLTFPVQLVNTLSPPQNVTLTNIGTGVLSIAAIRATGDFTQQNGCGSTVYPGGSCTISVGFQPQHSGTRTGMVQIADNADDSPQTIPLVGIGTVVELSVIGLNFGNQKVGTTSRSASVTMTNTASQSLLISSIIITGANADDFAQTNTCGSSLAAHASCKFKITFTPTALGARSATLAITDNGGGSPQTVQLNGNGT